MGPHKNLLNPEVIATTARLMVTCVWALPPSPSGLAKWWPVMSLLALILFGLPALAQQPATLLIEAEPTPVGGPAELQTDYPHISGNEAIWIKGGAATWDAITPAGTYRLLLRVRAGWSQDQRVRGQG